MIPVRKITIMIPFQLIKSVIKPPNAKLKAGTIIMMPEMVAKTRTASERSYESLIIVTTIKIIEALKAKNKKEKEILCQKPMNKKLTNIDNEYDPNFG